jgi:hypothetical protein
VIHENQMNVGDVGDIAGGDACNADSKGNKRQQQQWNHCLQLLLV